MGVELIKTAIAAHGALPAKQYKVLMRMCISAHDKGTEEAPARVYRGGWEPLGMALGYDVTDPEKRRWIRTEVTRACRQLRAAGVISPLVDKPGVGTRQYWRIEPMVGG